MAVLICFQKKRRESATYRPACSAAGKNNEQRILNQQIEIIVALPENSSYGVVAIFLHNKDQMYFPKLDETYGSSVQTIKFKKELIEKNASSMFMMDYQVKMTHWKALDTEEKRCDNSNSAGNVTGCIAKYIEKEIGCSMNLALSDLNVER